MRIGINLAFLDPAQTGGAETYCRKLLTNLAQLPDLQAEDRFVVFVPTPTDINIHHPSFELIPCPIDASRRKRRILWEQISLAALMQRERLDLAHFPYGTFPWSYAQAAVLTLHDTVRFCLPKQLDVVEATYRRVNEIRARRLKHHVITVSRHDGEIFAKNMAYPSNRLHTIYHGIDTPHKSDSGKVPQRPKSVELIWFGRPYPHKNVDVLFEVMAMLQETHCPIKLSLIGIPPEQMERFQRQITAYRLENRVTLAGPKPHSELMKSLSPSHILVFPSKYESFGMPVLEAMARDVPCICAEHPVFRELYGDTVLYATAERPEEFARLVEHVLDNPECTQLRIQLARQKASEYSWQRCARETYLLYRKIVESKSVGDS